MDSVNREALDVSDGVAEYTVPLISKSYADNYATTCLPFKANSINWSSSASSDSVVLKS